jgi:hypothetical protein
MAGGAPSPVLLNQTTVTTESSHVLVEKRRANAALLRSAFQRDENNPNEPHWQGAQKPTGELRSYTKWR